MKHYEIFSRWSVFMCFFGWWLFSSLKSYSNPVRCQVGAAHLVDEEREAQRGWVTSPGPHSQEIGGDSGCEDAGEAVFPGQDPQWYPARQSLRLDPKGKSLKDEDVLQKLPVGTTATLYFRDLGAQISWVTVFLTEYAGPLFIYLLFYFRVPFIYGHRYDFTSSRHTVVHLACICHSFHYVKRLLETLFVHRFSHGTMPLRNIFKNCTYYWGFAAWMAYYINHPLYTPPTYGAQQVKLALAIFVICQLGNFSIHMALRDLRPAGSKTRKIPYPTKNPFTWLFLLVSCPNYTYEVGSWIGFAIMTQCLPVALFSLVGFTQMTIWAKGKHRSYLKEFRDYPPLRMPIIPFLL
uniref:Trans-2,3-enoyl-CoA reductase n=1 Tax=Equus caballus TaxID=9796 RepID=A0A5F5PGU0_HORSE